MQGPFENLTFFTNSSDFCGILLRECVQDSFNLPTRHVEMLHWDFSSFGLNESVNILEFSRNLTQVFKLNSNVTKVDIIHPGAFNKILEGCLEGRGIDTGYSMYLDVITGSQLQKTFQALNLNYRTDIEVLRPDSYSHGSSIVLKKSLFLCDVVQSPAYKLILASSDILN